MGKSSPAKGKALTKQRLNQRVAESKKKDVSAIKSSHGKRTLKAAAPVSKKARKVSDKQRIKDLESALATAQEELEKRDKELANKENQPVNNLPKVIPKPKGSAGDGFSLIKAMGLEDDTELYDAVRRNVRENASGVGLDWRKDFRAQDLNLLNRAYKLGRKQFPFLSNYVNDWPQAEIIRQWFANRRRHGVREGYLPKREERLAEEARAGNVPLVDGATRKKSHNRQRVNEDEEGDSGAEGNNEDPEKDDEGGRGDKGDEDQESSESEGEE